MTSCYAIRTRCVCIIFSCHVPKVVTDISEQLYLPRLTVQLRPGAPTRHPYLIPSPSVPMLTTSDVLPTGNAQV